MKTLTEHMNESIVSERRIYRTLEDCIVNFITDGIIHAWDEAGLEFNHKDIKDVLEKIAKEYDVDKEISWAKNHMD